jgi:hypothetical protein
VDDIGAELFRTQDAGDEIRHARRRGRLGHRMGWRGRGPDPLRGAGRNGRVHLFGSAE